MAAELTYGEKKEVKKVRLPYREPFNQAAVSYTHLGKVCWTAVHSMQARLLPMEPTVTSGAGVLPVPVMIMET